jgi:hypothetical protein
MQTSPKKRPVRNGLHVLALAGLTSIMSIGSAAVAQQPQTARSAYQYYQQGPGGVALSRQDRADFDRSGTRGRMGLGASPYHPEGPGNVSN